MNVNTLVLPGVMIFAGFSVFMMLRFSYWACKSKKNLEGFSNKEERSFQKFFDAASRLIATCFSNLKALNLREAELAFEVETAEVFQNPLRRRQIEEELAEIGSKREGWKSRLEEVQYYVGKVRKDILAHQEALAKG